MDDKFLIIDGIEHLIRSAKIPTYAGEGESKAQFVGSSNYRFCQDPIEYMVSLGYTHIGFDGVSDEFAKGFEGTELVKIRVYSLHDSMIPQPEERGWATIRFQEGGSFLPSRSGRYISISGKNEYVAKVWEEMKLGDYEQSAILLKRNAK